MVVARAEEARAEEAWVAAREAARAVGGMAVAE